MKSRSFFFWYRTLRTHYNWTFFQSIRQAMWLAG